MGIAKNNNKQNNEPLKVMRCFDNFLITEFVTEVNKDGALDRIASFTLCCRKFMNNKPDSVIDACGEMQYNLPQCATCVKEITHFGRSFRMLDKSCPTPREADIREFLSAMVRAQANSFIYSKDWREKHKGTKILAQPGRPVFNNYNPDQFVEAKKIPVINNEDYNIDDSGF